MSVSLVRACCKHYKKYSYESYQYFILNYRRNQIKELDNRTSISQSRSRNKRGCTDDDDECPYCPYVSIAHNYKNGIKIHIGHQHKCKRCHELHENCHCSRRFNYY